MSAVITVRIPRELKEELKKRGVNISVVVRKALEKELEKIREEELKRAARGLGEFFEKIGEEKILNGIREDRGRG